MNRLNAELQRLYGIHGLATPVGTDSRVSVVVLGFARAADWALVAKFLRDVQDDLKLPPPAVSVAGGGGYHLWFSLDEPVEAERAGEFLRLMCCKFLSEVPADRLRLWPGEEENSLAEARQLVFPPVRDAGSGKWSAFIEPDLGSMFVEEPGLEMAPNEERQADLLSGLKRIRPDVFQNLLARLRQQPTAGNVFPSETPIPGTGAEVKRPISGLSLGGGFADPKSFLLAVMNDPAANAELRVEAAKALLPYFDGERRLAKGTARK